MKDMGFTTNILLSTYALTTRIGVRWTIDFHRRQLCACPAVAAAATATVHILAANGNFLLQLSSCKKFLWRRRCKTNTPVSERIMSDRFEEKRMTEECV